MRRVSSWLVLGWLVGALLVLILGPGCMIPKPEIDCRVLGCPAGHHCAQTNPGSGPWECVADAPPPPAEDCRTLGCGHGEQCVMDDTVIEATYVCRPIPAPGPTCNPGDVCGCWVFPPDEPAWRELSCPAPPTGGRYDCVDRLCVYTAPPEPPEPPAEPGTCGLREEDLVPATCSSPQFLAEVKRATDALGPATGTPPDESLAALAHALQAEGWCATAGSEAVFILRDDGLVEENHAVSFGTGGWTGNGSGKFIGCHRPTEPPVADACPAPRPDRDPAKLRINGKPHNRWVDTTITTWNTLDYCTRIGMGDNGTRRSCPMRNEGNPYRAACEAYAAGGATVWQTDPAGRTVELNDGNPWQARTDPGVKLRVCVADLSVCSKWIDQP